MTSKINRMFNITTRRRRQKQLLSSAKNLISVVAAIMRDAKRLVNTSSFSIKSKVRSQEKKCLQRFPLIWERMLLGKSEFSSRVVATYPHLKVSAIFGSWRLSSIGSSLLACIAPLVIMGCGYVGRKYPRLTREGFKSSRINSFHYSINSDRTKMGGVTTIARPLSGGVMSLRRSLTI